MTREERAELEMEWADFRVFQDRIDRLATANPLEAVGEAFALELGEVVLEVEAWERAVAGEGAGIVLVVTGGRAFGDRAFVYRSLDRVHAKRRVRLLVQGGAPGADALAKAWAEDRGVPCKTEPAKWEDVDRPGAVVRYRADGTPYDAAAGGIRNGVMLDKYKPQGVVAFPGGRGTNDCCTQAKARGVKVWRPRA